MAKAHCLTCRLTHEDPPQWSAHDRLIPCIAALGAEVERLRESPPKRPVLRPEFQSLLVYTVQEGDTLHEIGRKTATPWRRIAEVNRLRVERACFSPGDYHAHIEPGWKLIIPPNEE